MKTQYQYFWDAHQVVATQNNHFMEMVRDGLTAGELEELISWNPADWDRFKGWIERLPKGGAQ